MKTILTLILAANVLIACGDSTPKKVVNHTADSVETAVVTTPIVDICYSSQLNQTARIIAGINIPSDTMFSQIRNSEQWKTYAKESDAAWKSYRAKNGALMKWIKEEVVPVTTGTKSLFYPFSGPDFLYANMLFPDVEMIYMLGLEKLGSVPNFHKIKSIDEYINSYKTAINEILQDSYYRTINMMSALNNKNTDGVLPIIMLYMARANKQISEINYITLNENGEIVSLPKNSTEKPRNRGIEIKYYSGKDQNERRLVFFTGDVQESALENNPACKKYMSSIKTEAAFSKAASYLMHHKIFSTVRNTILKNCNIVVSDDTGIAYHFYDPKVWDIQLYGSYNGCINDFKYIFEKDLDAAYKDSTRNIKPLTFRIGYSVPSNARIVTRKK